MATVEISILAAGALLSLLAGGETARWTLAPIDRAYADQRVASPSDFSTGVFAPQAASGAPAPSFAPVEVAYRSSAPPPAPRDDETATKADDPDDSPTLIDPSPPPEADGGPAGQGAPAAEAIAESEPASPADARAAAPASPGQDGGWEAVSAANPAAS